MRASAVPTGVLALAGAGATVVLVVEALAAHEAGALVPGAIPAAFLVAGVLGGRAQPSHRGVQLLLGVGAFHLLAFAISETWVAQGRPSDAGAWALTAISVASYAVGFGALALLLATYPSGRLATTGLRRFAAVCATVVVAVVVVEVLLTDAVPVVLSREPVSVPAPGGLPLARVRVDLQPLLPVMVVAGVVVLVARARRGSVELRRQVEWATLAGVLLGLLLVATPFAAVVVPAALWAVVFVSCAALVPFALLGGLVRHRLLDVDVLVGRTVARGAMVVVVLACYATAAWTLGSSGPDRIVASVGLTLLAVFTGRPLLRRAEDLADRWFTGGRVHRGVLVDALTATLTAADPERLPARICTTLREGLDASWVRLFLGTELVAVSGDGSGDPAVTTDLSVGGRTVGRLEWGPRRAGWGRAELGKLARVGPQVAYALRDRELSHELAARVEELTSSRARLVRAEETVRRQVERDLHDGVQQQLVALLARLSVVRALLPDETAAREPLEAAHDLAGTALADLRRLVAGIHPVVLGDRGLAAAVESRCGLLPISVAIDADPRIVEHRFAPEVEGAAFFVVSEALANVMKHSGSEHARVVIAPLDGAGLRVAVSDEGSGSASYDGTGLTGLRDRVEALGGRFVLQATPGVGTTVLAEFAGARTMAGSDA